MAQYARYVHGPTSGWPGYCEYDSHMGRYRHFPDHTTQHPPWYSMSVARLHEHIQREAWVLDIPADLRLPKGF